MRKIFIAWILVIIQIPSYSQPNPTQTIRGRIVDADSNYPLVGATIQLLFNDSSMTTIGGVADIDGQYEIHDVPLGRQNFLCRYLGYKDQVINDYLVIQGKEAVIDIRLVELVTAMNEVVVYSRQKGTVINEIVSVSASTLETDEIIRFSGTLGDVSRMAQNFAGVSGSNDNRNDIIVRGNSPSSVLWRMEGVDIPSPNHWATLGATGGPVSMLNTNNLRTSDFLSGAFPAEYGNVVGAVFDLKLRNGNNEKHEFLGQVGFNGFELGAEGPMEFLGDNASFLINARYSTLELVSNFGFELGTGASVPEYKDINFKMNIPTKKAGSFSIWGLGGISDISFSAGDETDNLYSANNENLISGTNTGMLGINHIYFFNKNTSSTLSMALSGTKNRNTREGEIPVDSDQYQQIFDGNSKQNKSTINWTINSKLNPRNLIKIGANVDAYHIRILDSVFLDNSFWFYDSDFRGNTSLSRLFGQWQHKFNDKIKLNTGVNAIYFGLNNSFSIEPRIGMIFEFNPKNTLAIAFGRHSQLHPLPVYFSKNRNATPTENNLNKELDFIKSHHYVLSYTYHFTNKLRAKIETYYQDLTSIAVDPKEGSFSALNFGADFDFPNNAGLVNNGTGVNYGVEITLQQNLQKGFYFLLTGSLFDSKYKGSDGVERNTYFNSNYVFNTLFGKEIRLKKNAYITIDSKFTYAGGRRYTPIDLQASIDNGEETLDNTRVFENQYDPFIRPDFKIGIKVDGKKVTQTWSVDLQNFIGRKNVFIQSYNQQNQSINTLYQRGFFPDVRYQIVF